MMDKSQIIEARVTAQFPPLKARATADTRVNMSVPHLISAVTFCRRVRELENDNSGKPFGEFWHDIFANASGTVFAAVAAMESYANELFIDHKVIFPELRVGVMAKLWELFEKKSILDKFEFAVLLKNGQSLDRSASPCQDVLKIIQLRNGLIHFKPEWFSTQKEHKKLSSSLKDWATPSQFFPTSEPLFPRVWASHATTEWVIQSTLKFLLDFERCSSVPPKIEQFRHRFDEL